LAGPAPAGLPQGPAVVGSELTAGALRVTGVAHDSAAAARVRPTDGGLAGWVGTPTGFAGAATYSRGEYI
jgi:hypothetical protein